MGAKHAPPSKVKYDKLHPVISIRLSLELKQKLDDMKEKSGKSSQDVFREAVGLQTANLEAQFQKGYDKAKVDYLVTYQCALCGKPRELTGPKEKMAVAEYMAEHKWGHRECVQHMLTKEGDETWGYEIADYRFEPDPDLVPIIKYT